MSVFNITDHIVFGGRPRKDEILKWLSQNVGTNYGVGDPTRNVTHIGNGWEMRVESHVEPFTDDLILNWEVDITDEVKSTHFALVWIK